MKGGRKEDKTGRGNRNPFMVQTSLVQWKPDIKFNLPGAAAEWPTGNGKKLSSRQAQLGQATCLVVA